MAHVADPRPECRRPGPRPGGSGPGARPRTRRGCSVRPVALNASIPACPSDQNSRLSRTTSWRPAGASAFTAARSLAGLSGVDRQLHPARAAREPGIDPEPQRPSDPRRRAAVAAGAVRVRGALPRRRRDRRRQMTPPPATAPSHASMLTSSRRWRVQFAIMIGERRRSGGRYRCRQVGGSRSRGSRCCVGRSRSVPAPGRTPRSRRRAAGQSPGMRAVGMVTGALAGRGQCQTTVTQRRDRAAGAGQPRPAQLERLIEYVPCPRRGGSRTTRRDDVGDSMSVLDSIPSPRVATSACTTPSFRPPGRPVRGLQDQHRRARPT